MPFIICGDPNLGGAGCMINTHLRVHVGATPDHRALASHVRVGLPTTLNPGLQLYWAMFGKVLPFGVATWPSVGSGSIGHSTARKFRGGNIPQMITLQRHSKHRKAIQKKRTHFKVPNIIIVLFISKREDNLPIMDKVAGPFQLQLPGQQIEVIRMQV